MEKEELYELMLDNIPYGLYILDEKGNYIYANSVYLSSIGMTKQEILSSNVSSFLERGEVPYLVSDIVYKEKRSVTVYQDVNIATGINIKSFRQLIMSNPVFDDHGNVQNIVASCMPQDRMDSLIRSAESNESKRMTVTIRESGQVDFPVVASSQAMQGLLLMARTVAKTDATVLISGESGTGKEVIAQYIHRESERKNAPLVVINCASLPETLLEAELFGYEKGAFTGASAQGKKGLIEEADGGTLFLDEINSLPLALQGKFLRALETQTIQRIGSTKTKRVNFRLIAAANEDLEKMVAEKHFRTDLFYRLNVVPLKLLPLRNRQDDILPLSDMFLGIYNQKYEKHKLFTANTRDRMIRYAWPGNVRELRNFVERAVIMSSGDMIEIPQIELITDSLGGTPPTSSREAPPDSAERESEKALAQGLGLGEYMERCERAYVQYALEQSGSTYAAAKLLQTSQSAVMRKKKKYNL